MCVGPEQESKAFAGNSLYGVFESGRDGSSGRQYANIPVGLSNTVV